MAKKWFLAAAMIAAGVLLVAFTPYKEKDVPGSTDPPPLFIRIPGWYISRYEEWPFSTYQFVGAHREKYEISGHMFVVSYSWAGDGRKMSSEQVIENYENALPSVNGTVQYRKEHDFITFQAIDIHNASNVTWMEIASEIEAGWGGFVVTVVEQGVMEQSLPVDTEGAMATSLRTTGRAIVRGLEGNLAKSGITPDAHKAIAEIAGLLKQEGGLKIVVVGHVANGGNADAELKRSQENALTVVKVLIDEYGIRADRLRTFGAGSNCPMTTNLTQEGRAQNQRIELVQQ
jgi:outer membrane protein OmpA-like peptidoglycan-associated protein